MSIGRLEPGPLRALWPREEVDFTHWLAENLDTLAEQLNPNFTLEEQDARVGDFLVDLLAKMGVWICVDPRPKHQCAIQWLNEVAPEDMVFYLVKVETFRTGDSPPAPWFRLVVGPTSKVRAVGRQRKDLVEREILCQQFWTEPVNRAYTWLTPSSKIGLAWSCTSIDLMRMKTNAFLPSLHPSRRN